MATEETIPNTQSTNKTTAIVSSILISFNITNEWTGHRVKEPSVAKSWKRAPNSNDYFHYQINKENEGALYVMPHTEDA